MKTVFDSSLDKMDALLGRVQRMMWRVEGLFGVVRRMWWRVGWERSGSDGEGGNAGWPERRAREVPAVLTVLRAGGGGCACLLGLGLGAPGRVLGGGNFGNL